MKIFLLLLHPIIVTDSFQIDLPVYRNWCYHKWTTLTEKKFILNASNKIIQELRNRQQLVLSTTSVNPVRNLEEFC